MASKDLEYSALKLYFYGPSAFFLTFKSPVFINYNCTKRATPVQFLILLNQVQNDIRVRKKMTGFKFLSTIMDVCSCSEWERMSAQHYISLLLHLEEATVESGPGISDVPDWLETHRRKSPDVYFQVRREREAEATHLYAVTWIPFPGRPASRG